MKVNGVDGLLFPQSWNTNGPARYNEEPPGCDEYVGFLKPGATCENCGERCGDHKLPPELVVRVWRTTREDH